MRTSIFSSVFDEADTAMSPQLPDATAPTSAFRPSPAPSERALVVVLAAELEASEARARDVEFLLAAHGRRCICRAAEIAVGEAVATTSLWTADAADDLPLSLAA